MRKLLLLGQVFLCLCGIVRGQEVGLPTCSEAQMSLVAALAPEYYALMESAIAEDISLDLLFEYSEARFAWREAFWSTNPACKEAFDIGRLMDETAADFAADMAYEIAGVSADESPYAQEMNRGASKLIPMLDALEREPESRAGESEEPGLPTCTDIDLGILTTVLNEFEALLKVPPRTVSKKGLAKYGVAQITWRSQLWTRLSPCDLALQAGLLMSWISSDVAVELALEIGGLSVENSLYSEQIMGNQERLRELTEPIVADERARASSRGFAATLSACPDTESLDFYVKNQAFQELVDKLEVATTLPQLLDLADTHVEWRETLAAHLPACVGSLVTATLAYRATGNHISALTLDVAGIKPELDPEFPIEGHLFGIVTIRFIADSMKSTIEGSGKQIEQLEKEAAARAGSLPECGAGDLGLNFYNAFIEYSDLAEIAKEVENVRDVLVYRQAQVDWGERHIPILPGCKAGMEAGLLMYTILADYSTAYAFIIAGAAVEEIPYAQALRENEARLDALLQETLR